MLLAASARLAFGDELSDALLSDPQAWHRVVQEREASVHQIERARRRLDSMNDPNSAKRGRLIDLIAKLRIVECADLLVDRFETPALAIDEPAPLASFPAGAALVEIGCPVIAQRRLQQALQEHILGKSFQGEDQPYTRNLRRLVEIVTTVDFAHRKNLPHLLSPTDQ